MQPNFLFFIVDQLNSTHLGSSGNKIIATPHIDDLAKRGWCASECHVATPICMPNRASLLTGRMPSVHGVRHNGIPLSLGSRTFVDALREAGYLTSLAGKGHFQNITDRSPLKGGGFTHDAHLLFPGNYAQECVTTWDDDPAFDVQTPYYGFDRIQLAIEHGDCPQGHYRRWLAQHHPGVLAKAGRSHAIPTPDYDLAAAGQAWRTQVPEELHPSAWIADQVVDDIVHATKQAKPFFAYCSFPDPHHPYTPPGKYWDMYKPEDVELPPSFHSNTPPPPHLEWLRDERDAQRAVKNTQACFATTEREAREAIALNYGSLSFIDSQVGKVMRALERSGQLNNTVVIFTSDHGEFAGDHQLLLKGSLHYSSVTRTPLIWHDSLAMASHSSELLSTIDIAPTILERAGVPGYNGLQGRTFLPLVKGTGAYCPRQHLLIEEEGQRTYFGFDHPVKMRSVLSKRYRMSVYEGVAWGELYDRQTDPTDSANLWDDQDHVAVKSAMTQALCMQMLAHTETSPMPTALA